MSTRVLASIGVALCVLMTSFSIYLGVIEHIYAPTSRVHSFLLETPIGARKICVEVRTSHGHTTKITPRVCPAHVHTS